MMARTILGVAAVCAIAGAGLAATFGVAHADQPNLAAPERAVGQAPPELVNAEAQVAPDLNEFARLAFDMSCAMPPSSAERLQTSVASDERLRLAQEAKTAALRVSEKDRQESLTRQVALVQAWPLAPEGEGDARARSAKGAAFDAGG